jgi:hypothetical protein
VLIKGALFFTIDQHSLKYLNQMISPFGVTGLPWAPLNSNEYFGRTLLVEIQPSISEKTKIEGPAQILREFTLNSRKMAIRFHFDYEQSQTLENMIEKHGSQPSSYQRKLPRIPSSKIIKSFPLKASLQSTSLGLEAPHGRTTPILCDVENLSPNGILVSTENQSSLSFNPGDSIQLTLDPRGWFPFPIHAQGKICRIIDDFCLESSNILRHLGIQFTSFTEEDKKAFLTLLKDILQQLKIK